MMATGLNQSADSEVRLVFDCIGVVSGRFALGDTVCMGGLDIGAGIAVVVQC